MSWEQVMCSPVHHITQSYRISSGKDFASRQYRCTSLLHLCLFERNAWSILYPVEIVWLDLMKQRGSLKTKWYFQRRNLESTSGHIYLDEEVISFCLGRIRRIWLIKQVLNSHKNLFHSYGWSPPLHIPEVLLCYTRASSLWLVSNPMNNTSYKLFRVAKGTYTILVKNG